MTPRIIAFCLFALLLPHTAAALDMTCHFTVECYEAEECDEADFVLDVRDSEEDGHVRLGGPVDDIRGRIGTAQSGSRVVVARSQSSMQLLTIGPDETARYTLHLTDGPAMISYTGICEEDE
ncbi:hypothetical protein [Meridianimarinicoccus aquatilis]|uniref:Uncharacterized protein n=1 Tax=Meridianimarinicoccus aquatilis TaxID=2552766 RepID=A0A4R6B0H7_9RHOB|nr:hypothetical protein [Fluviibacterium aquatile]QIE42595.1 hypothetical protein G5B39_12025 [Rhodobacteraceae bacterium SC52]TDL87953.1 hypothetical protein E2L05_10125 [Fluviibacterium aquatile]